LLSSIQIFSRQAGNHKRLSLVTYSGKSWLGRGISSSKETLHNHLHCSIKANPELSPKLRFGYLRHLTSDYAIKKDISGHEEKCAVVRAFWKGFELNGHAERKDSEISVRLEKLIHLPRGLRNIVEHGEREPLMTLPTETNIHSRDIALYTTALFEWARDHFRG
jgi:hypothetical protein